MVRTCSVGAGYSVDKAAFAVKIRTGKVGLDLFLVLEASVESKCGKKLGQSETIRMWMGGRTLFVKSLDLLVDTGRS